MSNFWLKVKIWTKMLLLAAVFVYIILFTYKNAQQRVQFWYWFNHRPDTTLLLLVVCAFFAGAIGALLLRASFRTIRQVQDLQERTRAQRLDREVADMKTKAAMLQTRPAQASTPPPPPKPTVIETLENRQQP
ncbi:MAG TPA: hypothetical protein VN541_00960 [Tepidisphaeraceae bacterium]|nr:hypothetical protein [Tepidisphaeraceae bacterium]